MKQRIDLPVFTWFLIGALLFSICTFLLGIWVCSNAPRAGFESGEDVPTVVETPETADTGPIRKNTPPMPPTQLPAAAPEKPVKSVRIETKPLRKSIPVKSGANKKTETKSKRSATVRKPGKKKKPRKKPDIIRSGRTYYVQLTATVNRKQAEKMKQAYEGKGYNMYLVIGKKQGHLIYKVRIGVFKDWKKAKAIAEKIRREDKLKPWIIAM